MKGRDGSADIYDLRRTSSQANPYWHPRETQSRDLDVVVLLEHEPNNALPTPRSHTNKERIPSARA